MSRSTSTVLTVTVSGVGAPVFLNGKTTLLYGLPAVFFETNSRVVLRQGKKEYDDGVVVALNERSRLSAFYGFNALPVQDDEDSIVAYAPAPVRLLTTLRPRWFRTGNQLYIPISAVALRAHLLFWSQSLCPDLLSPTRR